MKAEMPRRGMWVQTPEGPGEVVNVNVLRSTVTVLLSATGVPEEFSPQVIQETTNEVANQAKARNAEGITPAVSHQRNRGERRLLREEFESSDMLAALAALEDKPDEQSRGDDIGAAVRQTPTDNRRDDRRNAPPMQDRRGPDNRPTADRRPGFAPNDARTPRSDAPSRPDAPPRPDEQIRHIAVHHGNPVCPVHLAQGQTHRLNEMIGRGLAELDGVFADEVGQHLGVGFGLENVTLALQFGAELQVILNHAIMHQHDASALVGMRVGILPGHRTMRGPAGMADTAVAVHRLVGHQLRQILDAADRFADLERPIVAQSKPRRIIAAIFQTAQTIQ
jgi:hypothetical protein